ncbi:O-antigen ligase family protein [Anaerosalibacter massiliensis]|uniref:O-antigen ligase family protein n=1 Tax=Anaerosalibacter massiliensis TaxID=1347392 RepID=A0A9X2MM72_9FIRM|nr:O-antigen ligase family protein [Anaerosalibacter massiliensis]MCR2045610.1 O-antigen ligase family protein [Anaerosalibacter massiliensis]
MVENLKKKESILPILVGIFFGLIYFKLPINIFIVLFLGFIIMVATLYNVKIGIYLSVFLMPYLPFTLALIFMLFVFFAYIYKGIFKKIEPFSRDPIDIPIALFIITIIISTLTSIDPKGSLRDLVFHLISIGFVFVTVNNIKNKKDLNILFNILVITATLVALYGIYQYKIQLKTTDIWLSKNTSSGIVTRVFSVFDNPNVLAEYLIMILPISMSLFYNSKKVYKKLTFLLTTVILAGGLGLTYSRGGWLGFIFSVLIFVFLVEKRLFFVFIPLGILILPFLPPTILNRIRSINDLGDSSNLSRFQIWLTTIEIIKDNWIAGVGLGSKAFMHAYRSYSSETFTYYHSHNTYLQVAAEMGIGGVIVFLMLIFIIYKYTVKNLIKYEDRWIKVSAAGVLSGLSAVFIHSLVDDIFFMPETIITFWTLISFILVLTKISKNAKEIS